MLQKNGIDIWAMAVAQNLYIRSHKKRAQLLYIYKHVLLYKIIIRFQIKYIVLWFQFTFSIIYVYWWYINIYVWRLYNQQSLNCRVGWSVDGIFDGLLHKIFTLNLKSKFSFYFCFFSNSMILNMIVNMLDFFIFFFLNIHLYIFVLFEILSYK